MGKVILNGIEIECSDVKVTMKKSPPSNSFEQVRVEQFTASFEIKSYSLPLTMTGPPPGFSHN